MSFAGGPIVVDILSNFGDHIVRDIYAEIVGGEIRIHSFGYKLVEWMVSEYADQFRQLVSESGINELTRGSFRHCGKYLIAALVERWQPYTNTFHLPDYVSSQCSSDLHKSNLQHVFKNTLISIDPYRSPRKRFRCHVMCRWSTS